ncbi:MAG: methyltransferase domain-containing protein [Planctomycetota bacterium]
MKAPTDPASVLVYPPALERRVVEAVHALAPRSTEGEAIDRLIPAARELSDLFTVRRPSVFPDYAADAMMRFAYGLYFAPQTWVRTRLALAEALEPRPRALGADGRVHVLDLGAGLGTAGLAAAHFLRTRAGATSVRLVAVDRSSAALSALAAQVASSPDLAGVDVAPVVGDLARLDALPAAAAGPFDLIVVSFALNEAFPPGDDAAPRAWLASLATRLAPTGVLLVVEPALHATATRLRTLVAPLAEAGTLAVLAPDLHGRIAAPHPDPRFVDHEVRRWALPESVKRVNRILRRSLDELTFAFVALSPTAAPPYPDAPRRVRVTSPFGRLKGRRAFTSLDTTGARPTFDLLERTLSDDDETRVRAIERGDHVEILDCRPLGEPGWSRLPGPDAVRTAWHPR